MNSIINYTNKKRDQLKVEIGYFAAHSRHVRYKNVNYTSFVLYLRSFENMDIKIYIQYYLYLQEKINVGIMYDSILFLRR